MHWMDIAALSSDFFFQFYIYINGIVWFILMGDGEIYDNNALIEIGLFFFFLLKINVLIHRIFCPWKIV